MKPVKCPKCNLFYNADKYSSCPYCKKNEKEATDNLLEDFLAEEKIVEETNLIPEAKEEKVAAVEESLSQAVEFSRTIDTERTVAYAEFEDNSDPVVGWLVCLKGEYIGQSFELVSGRNNIGRSLSNHIALAKEKTVSREKHASILFDPKEKEFYISPGEESGLTYLNGELIMEHRPLKDRDCIELGMTKFLFVQLCSKDCDWHNIDSFLKK